MWSDREKKVSGEGFENLGQTTVKSRQNVC